MTAPKLVAMALAACALMATVGVVPAAASTGGSRVSAAAFTWPDYCGGSGRSAIVPDRWYRVNWTSECDNHDKCYASSRSRLDCDKAMLVEMKSACLGAYYTSRYRRPVMYQICLTRTRDYYVGLRLGAKKSYQGTGDPR